MTRPVRIEYEDAYYHVMNRGRGYQRIFRASPYRQAFLSTLADAHERFGVMIHGYCLMGNHYHLLLQTPHGNLGRVMRHINGSIRNGITDSTVPMVHYSGFGKRGHYTFWN